MEKMFGSDDQPHFLGRGARHYNQQQQKAEAEREPGTAAAEPGARGDFDSLDRILQSPTTSQMMRDEPFFYRQDDPTLYEPIPPRYQQGPLYAQAQKQSPPKPAEKPVVTATGEPFFAPTSRPSKSPSSQQPI